MKVLSLFDGISCGMVALERAGIPVEVNICLKPNKKVTKKILSHLNFYINSEISPVKPVNVAA